MSKARRAHDRWNIGALGLLCAFHAYTAVYASYALFLRLFVAYVALDTLYIGAVPACVRSPRLLLLHHAMTLLGLCGVWSDPYFAWVGAGLEYDSILLIATRYWWRGSLPRWTVALRTIVRLAVRGAVFYWVLIWAPERIHRIGGVSAAVVWVARCGLMTFTIGLVWTSVISCIRQIRPSTG